jgi:hypothetical protein
VAFRGTSQAQNGEMPYIQYHNIGAAIAGCYSV